jgi:hypothetical protein
MVPRFFLVDLALVYRNVSLEYNSPGFPQDIRGPVWHLYGPFSTWFDSKIPYAPHENAVPNKGQRLYPNLATAVDQICRF